MVKVTGMSIGVCVLFCATETWMVALPEPPVSSDGITETSMRAGVPPETGIPPVHGGAAVPAVPASMAIGKRDRARVGGHNGDSLWQRSGAVGEGG